MIVETGEYAVDLVLPAPPWAVFRVYVDPVLKRRWLFDLSGVIETHFRTDIRTGGSEEVALQIADGVEMRAIADFVEVVPEQHMISTYKMLMDGQPTSVSICDVRMSETAGGTRLIHSESLHLYTGQDTVARRRDLTQWSLSQLGEIAASLDSNSRSAAE